tara:strand:+ start:179 stop:349 length:171 start_codon:yes stop_codon:yes gene_type:complete
MKSLLNSIVGILRSIADSLEKKSKGAHVLEDFDILSDVDDQRAHHFEALNELDDFK